MSKVITIEFLNNDKTNCGTIEISSDLENSLHELSDNERNFSDGDFDYEYEKVQLLEGRTYYLDIKTNDNYSFSLENNKQIKKIKDTLYSFNTGIHTGIIQFEIENPDGEKAYAIVEVQSIKAGSLKDYKQMLSDIGEKCNDLLMQIESPSMARFEINSDLSVETLTQRFYFLKSLIDSVKFKNAINRILHNPHIRSEGKYIDKNLSKGGFRIGANEFRQMARNNPRIALPKTNPLYKKLSTVPQSVTTIEHIDSFDTPENRFIKFALETFNRVLEDIKELIEEKQKHISLKKEIEFLQNKLYDYLNHNFFKDLSHATQLSLGSPVLQRKEGYREILRVWLQFELSAQLVWKGGEDMFKGGQRDIATLYEYWLFFKLIDSINEIFEMKEFPVDDNNSPFISSTDDGFGLKLSAGKHLKYTGTYSQNGETKLNIMFCYNRTFGNSKDSSYQSEGSWTKYMRPDYTVSLWPIEIEEAKNAEVAERIVHIHFDAKYRIVNPNNAKSIVDIAKLFDGGILNKIENDVFGDDNTEDLDKERESERKGIASKRADLLKMHAYKDAIKRTEGAYVLYPGSSDKNIKWQGYHELLPGIGAFPVCPGSSEDMSNVEQFLEDSAKLCVDKFSQLYRQRYWTKEIIAELPAQYGVSSASISKNNKFIPDSLTLPPNDTSVIIGGIRENVLNQCKTKGFFYFHAVDKTKNTIDIPDGVLSAKYLISYSTINGKIEWTGWFGKIKKCSLVSKMVLNKKIISQSQRPYYYLAEFETVDGNLTNELKNNPNNYNLPKIIDKPKLSTWGELWK